VRLPRANDGGSFAPSCGGEYPGFPLINQVDLLKISTDNEATPAPPRTIAGDMP
jgi:hypothetical protein